MITYLKYILISLLLFTTEWRCKGPVTIDYESAAGNIVGREKCSTNSNSNAWLINLQPLGSKTYGKSLTLAGKTYPNVVKTYTLDSNYQDSTKTYIFDFYQRDTISKPDCDLSGGNVTSVPQVAIIAVHNKG